MIRGWDRGTWLITGLVVLTALSTLLGGKEPELPGILRLGVVQGAGEQRTLRAITPLCDYLGSSIRRAVRPVTLDGDQLASAGLDLALAPASVAARIEGGEILAWAKGDGMPGAHARPFVIFSRERLWHDEETPRLAIGDPWTWAGGGGAVEYLEEHGHGYPEGFAVVTGRNPYDHIEAIASVAHGGADVAVARESDLRVAVETGVVDSGRFVFGPAGPAKRDFVLVAAPSLSPKARRKIREAALNLDLYRYDQKNQRVMVVLSALGLLGLQGFTPDRVLPSLRP